MLQKFSSSDEFNPAISDLSIPHSTTHTMRQVAARRIFELIRVCVPYTTVKLFLLLQLRIEGMLLKVEFKVNCDDLRAELGTLISVCTAVLESESLKQFLRYVLHTGNFINSVSTSQK